MKKIMFNERYGLHQAVLDRKKTMTRRIIKRRYEAVNAYHANGGWHFIADTEDGDSVELKPHYEIGERVAIAHGYEKYSSNTVCHDWHVILWNRTMTGFQTHTATRRLSVR